MKMKLFLDQYGYKTSSLVIRRLLNHYHPPIGEPSLRELAEEIANKLEEALKEVSGR